MMTDLVATMHMLDAHNHGQQWVCSCTACQIMRQRPDVLEAVWKRIKSSPPDPAANKTPPVVYVEP